MLTSWTPGIPIGEETDKDHESSWGDVFLLHLIYLRNLPDMMCPKKGTNMIGFLPESAASFHIMLSNLSHLRGGRDRGRQWLRARRRCILNTFGRCWPGKGSTDQMLEWNVCFVKQELHLVHVQCSLLMEFLYSFFSRKKKLYLLLYSVICICVVWVGDVITNSIWRQSDQSCFLCFLQGKYSNWHLWKSMNGVCGNLLKMAQQPYWQLAAGQKGFSKSGLYLVITRDQG